MNLKNQIEETPQNAGKPKIKFGPFVDTLANRIESRTGIRYAPNSGFYIKCNNPSESPRIATIHCGSKTMADVILCAIEMEKQYCNRIISIDDEHIVISENEYDAPVGTDKATLQTITTRIETAAQKYFSGYFSIERRSSLHFACESDEVVVVYIAPDDYQATIFQESVLTDFAPSRDGRIVRLHIAKNELQDFVAEEHLISLHSRYKGVVRTITKAPTHTTFVYSSRDYGDFHFLPFHSRWEAGHVADIIDSMNRHGATSFITVVITDCIDGVMRKWIVDGRARFKAFEMRESEVLYTIVTATSKKEIVRLIIDLNTNSRRWMQQDSLDLWFSVANPHYAILKELHETTKLPFGFLLKALSEKEMPAAMEYFESGEFEIVNEARGRRYVEYISDLRTLIPRSEKVYSVFLDFFRQQEETVGYDHQLMIQRFTDLGKKCILPASDSPGVVLHRIRNIYNGVLSI